MFITKHIKKYLAQKKLEAWHLDTSVPSKKRMQSVANGTTRNYTPEFEAFLDKAYIRRYCDANDVCVDVYWHIKPSRNERHILTIHYRRSWMRVRHTINHVEKEELPRAIYEAFKHINK